MTDATLLMIGCAVTFTAFAGAYIAIRGEFNESNTPRRQPVEARATKPPMPVTKPNAA